MKYFIFITLFFAGYFAQAQSCNGRLKDDNYVDAWSDAGMTAFLKKLKKARMYGNLISVTEAEVAKTPKGFTGKQTVQILNEFRFPNDKVKLIKIIDDKIMGITCEEAAAILLKMNHESGRITTLKAIKDAITDVENIATVLNVFAFQTEDAKKIVKDLKPRSYIYGTVRNKHVVFVVDLSGSMDAEITFADGSTCTRLNFVRQELKKALFNLAPSSNFNVIFFESEVGYWKSQMLQATPQNMESVLRYVGNQSAGGGTNIYGALKTAFNVPNVEMIYFLTDGMPTSGDVTDVDGILNEVENWNSNKHVVVNATAFLMGNYGGDDKDGSRKLMERLSKITNGTYRAIDNKSFKTPR